MISSIAFSLLLLTTSLAGAVLFVDDDVAAANASHNSEELDTINEEQRIHWLFLHYHKTGHDLTRIFCQAFQQSCSNQELKFRPARKNVLPYLYSPTSSLAERDISYLAGNELLFNWTLALNQPRHKYRVVHFVRDPFDMVLSAYLYHSQIPVPVEENWLAWTSFDPCKHDYSTLQSYLTPLMNISSMHSDYQLGKGPKIGLHEALDEAIIQCNQLRDRSGNKTPFNTRLRELAYGKNCTICGDEEASIYDAIRLEALRSLLSAYGGDILRMGANAAYESSTSLATSSLRVFLSDFPIGQWDIYERSVRNVIQYLTASDNELNMRHFWRAAGGLEEVSSKAMLLVHQSAMKAPADVTNHQDVDSSVIFGQGVHITATMWTTKQRRKFRDMLIDDPVIGTLLSAVQHSLQWK